jgi:hypothetical protein
MEWEFQALRAFPEFLEHQELLVQLVHQGRPG